MGLTTQTFDILNRLAVGNGTLVYRAVEKETLRQVALKLLAHEGDTEHHFDVQALLAEAPRLKQITGNHVCQLLDAYNDEDGAVLVYEFANGMSGIEVPQKRKVNAVQALDVSAQIISALRSGERQRTPHGDLKPSNFVFMEGPDGRPFVVVLDWGLAAFRGEDNADAMPFLAPERLMGAPVSHQADLFSAGAVLFYLLTGKVLAMGGNRDEVMLGWSRARPDILAEMRPDLAPKLVHWISGLLALDPQKRPSSAVEAGTALAGLNPPPPLVPPESFRARPAPHRAAAPVASGVVPPQASGGVHPVSSSVRPAPSSAGVPGPRTTAPVRAAQPPARKSNLMVVSLLLTLLTGAAAGGVWWFVRERNPSSRPLASGPAARTPSPSVTAPVATPVPRGLPPQTAKTDGKGKEDGEAVQKTAAKPASSKPPSKSAKGQPTAATSAKAASDPSKGPAEPEEFIAIEHFDYSAGDDLDGQASGHGWAAAWKGGGAHVEAASLSYPSHPVEGGSLLLRATEEELGWSRTVGPVKRLMRDPGKKGHWYFSAIVQHSDETPNAAGELRLNPMDPEDPRNLFYIAVADRGSGLRVSLSGAKGAVEIADASKPIFLLCRIELSPKNAAWDLTAQLLVNPNVASPNFTGGGEALTASLANVQLPTQIGLRVHKLRSQAITRLDEIRFGRHWEEMTFKPAQIDEPSASGKFEAKK